MSALSRAVAVAVLLVVAVVTPSANAACPLPETQRDLAGVHWYADAAGSIVDRDKRRRHELALKPLYDFLTVVARGADAAFTGGPTDDLDCAVAHLRAWAADDALTDRPTTIVPLAEQTIAAVGLHLAALKLRNAGRSTEVEDWLGRVAEAIVRTYETNSQRANLYAWAGVVAAANDVLSGTDRFRTFHDRVWREATAKVRSDGHVDAELSRAGRALIYHNYLRGGLALLHRLRSLRGIEASAEEVAALDRLQAVVNGSACDPTSIAERAGTAQEPLDAWSLSIGSHFAGADRDPRWSACTVTPPGFSGRTYGGRFDNTDRALEALARLRRTDR